MKRSVIILLGLVVSIGAAGLVSRNRSLVLEVAAGQTRGPKRGSKPSTAKPQAAKVSAAKYSAFLHASEKHKSLKCDACHRVPTVWTAKRDFPDVADFPNHDACVRCHRQQIFTQQAFAASGPAICTVCHLRAAPREDSRFAFGKPNNSNQAAKPKDERQFTIEFPHDKHQNVIALLHPLRSSDQEIKLVRASFLGTRLADEKQNAGYNNCSICHVTNNRIIEAPPAGWPDSFVPVTGTFKTQPRAHDVCFDCHWSSQKPTSDDCAGCHKLSAPFVSIDWPKRISARFSHEGGKGEHVMECTTCHINITRASTLRGLTPDVPITICATCHKDSKKTTYPKIVTIETEFDEFKKTGNCAYCHTSDVGKRKAPESHYAAVQ